MSKASWIVVTDFDGTLTEKDVGNVLCEEFLGERFTDIHSRYRRGELGLKEMQQLLWGKFPCPEETFRRRSAEIGRLRPGVVEFLELCQKKSVPLYIASCGLRPYIEPVLRQHLPPDLQSVVRQIRCNEATFDAHGIAEFLPPTTRDDCPYPLDKGAWSSELRAALGKEVKILGIGNGTSDRSFQGHVDELAATEALAKWCTQSSVAHRPFEDFRDLLGVEALRG